MAASVSPSDSACCGNGRSWGQEVLPSFFSASKRFPRLNPSSPSHQQLDARSFLMWRSQRGSKSGSHRAPPGPAASLLTPAPRCAEHGNQGRRQPAWEQPCGRGAGDTGGKANAIIKTRGNSDKHPVLPAPRVFLKALCLK